MSDIKNVRSFLFEFKDGTELRLVEKENYDKLVERIKELEEALLKVKDKNTTLFITCRNSVPAQKVKDTINENGFEVYTREYGNVEVVSIEVLEELLEESK